MWSIFKDSLEEIAQIFGSAKDSNELMWLFEDMLTPQEIVDISDRIKIIRLLKSWKTQRDIAEELGTSVTTVNRWSRILKYWTWWAAQFIK